MPLEKLGFGINLSTLDSGLNVITKAVPGNLVWAGLVVRDGSVYDPPGANGLAHLREHCIFDGIKSEAVSDHLPLISDHKTNWIVEGKGATLNGLNSYQSVTYVLDYHRKHLPLMLDVLLKIVLLPKLSKESVIYQKNVVCAELARDKENPLYGEQHSTHFDTMLREMLFDSNPIKNRFGGKREEVKTIGAGLVRKTFADFYAPNNLALIVVGQFKHSTIVDIVKKFESTYGKLLPDKLKKLPRVEAESLKETRMKKRVKVWESDHFEHLVINMGYRAPNLFHRDMAPLRILNGILGSFSFSRLYHHFRETKGLSYFAESRYFKTSIHGEFVVHANFHPKAREQTTDIIDQAQEFIVKQLIGIAKGDISEEEFEHVKKSLYAYDRSFGLESPEYFRDLLVNAFEANNFTDGVSISESIQRELDEVLKVKNCSLKRFLAAINRQIEPERYALLISGPPNCYPTS